METKKKQKSCSLAVFFPYHLLLTHLILILFELKNGVFLLQKILESKIGFFINNFFYQVLKVPHQSTEVDFLLQFLLDWEVFDQFWKLVFLFTLLQQRKFFTICQNTSNHFFIRNYNELYARQSLRLRKIVNCNSLAILKT